MVRSEYKVREVTMKKPRVKIRNVRFLEVGVAIRMHGVVIDHPRFEKDTEVITSSVKEVITRNTHYIIEED